MAFYAKLTFCWIYYFVEEAMTAMKALMKQAIVEALAANDTDVERGLLYEQLKHLNFSAWTKLMEQCMSNLTSLLNRIRAIHDIMVQVVALETGRQEEVLLNILNHFLLGFKQCFIC